VARAGQAENHQVLQDKSRRYNVQDTAVGVNAEFGEVNVCYLRYHALLAVSPLFGQARLIGGRVQIEAEEAAYLNSETSALGSVFKVCT
jgi:hypothetical protein